MSRRKVKAWRAWNATGGMDDGLWYSIVNARLDADAARAANDAGRKASTGRAEGE